MNFYDDAVKVFEHTARENAREAYKKGYTDGQADTPFTDTQRAEELAYERGLVVAWECARKIAEREDDMRNCFHDIAPAEIFTKYLASEAIEEIKKWEDKQKKTEKNCKTCGHEHDRYCNVKHCDGSYSKWTPKQDDTEIRVGDEVIVQDDIVGVVTGIIELFGLSDEIYVATKYGWTDRFGKMFIKKTGKYYPQIAEVLKQMQEDKE